MAKARRAVTCTPFTAALVRNKLGEHGLADDVPLRVLPMGSRFEAGHRLSLCGDGPVDPGAQRAGHRTAGAVVHSGDWKIDPSPSILRKRMNAACARSVRRASRRLCAEFDQCLAAPDFR
jgi:mRNA degradation ribonuclease J1/J2